MKDLCIRPARPVQHADPDTGLDCTESRPVLATAGLAEVEDARRVKVGDPVTIEIHADLDHADVRVAAAVRRRGRPGLSSYVKRPRPGPIDEDWIVPVILLGPFAYVARWIWRRLR